MKSSELWKIALLSVALSIPHPAAASKGTTPDHVISMERDYVTV